MRALWVAIAVLMALPAVWAQDLQPLSPITRAYRSGPTADHMNIEVPRGKSPPARGQLRVAIRPGDSPAVAMIFGEGDPLCVLARPGRLLAWRQSDRSRVFTAVLPEPFGRRAIEAVLPPVLAPQIDLALGEPRGGMLALMPDLSWSLVASGVHHRYAGVAPGAALTLATGADGRLAELEAQRDGRVVARARIAAVEVDESWFDAPPLDGIIVGTLADLGRPISTVRVGEPFGQAIGIDARGRATTLRTLAGERQRVVVLLLDARSAEDRTRLAGAMAEADLADLATKLGVTVVVLAVGDDDASALFERVTRASPSASQPVRVLAVDAMPAWAPKIGQGMAFAVDGGSWALLGSHMVPGADEGAGGVGPVEVSEAPRSLAERLAEAVGAAGRE